jgi:hypothetical protein
MNCRPPHGSPDIEAALARLEEIGGFKVEVRREGQIYAFLRHRSGEPECSSMSIWETPRHSLICAEKILEFAERRLADDEDCGDATSRREDEIHEGTTEGPSRAT